VILARRGAFRSTGAAAYTVRLAAGLAAALATCGIVWMVGRDLALGTAMPTRVALLLAGALGALGAFALVTGRLALPETAEVIALARRHAARWVPGRSGGA
jgi:hypothetical protein